MKRRKNPPMKTKILPEKPPIKINTLPACWILTHVRTGSTFLRYLLKQYGKFNEKFTLKFPYSKQILSKMNLSNDQDLNKFAHLLRTENLNTYYNSKEIKKMRNILMPYIEKTRDLPICSKVPRSQFIRFGFNDKDSDIIEKFLPNIKYIHLIRENFYDLVVSDYIAHEFQRWTIKKQSDNDRLHNIKIQFNPQKALHVFDNLYYECIENN